MLIQRPPMPDPLNKGMYIPQQRIPSGMGEVYLANDTSLKRQVVVKLVRIAKNTLDNNQDQQNALENFRREVDILSRVHHLHVIEIYYCGQEEQGNDVLVYMVMPYCKEGSLQDWIEQHRGNQPLDIEEVATLLGQAGEALKHLHDNGITHRDIKTTNFLVRDRSSDPSELPHILLADFGLAQTVGEDTSQDSLGTFQYKAPEQWLRWGPPDYKTDQYQLAIMAYYLLTYKHPFDCDKDLVKWLRKFLLKYQHTQLPAKAPSTHRPDIPHEIDKVILHALEKFPHNRYPSILEFVHAFRNASRTNLSNPSLPRRIFASVKTGRPKWVRLAALIVALILIIALTAPLLATPLHMLLTFYCSTTNPFPTTDSSSYPLPATQTVWDSSGCEQIGLSVGARFFDSTMNRPQKINIANELSSGNSQKQQDALTNLQSLTQDPEAFIYYEDQKILASGYPYVTIVIGAEFSSSLKGETQDALQGAYIGQSQWDQTPKAHGGFRLLLIVANAGDDSIALNIQNVISQVIQWQQKRSEVIGIVGWEDSTRTDQAIQALKHQSIPLISPSASGDNLTQGPSGNHNFFRVVSTDSFQASFAVNFALQKWPNARNIAIITTGDSPTGDSPTSTYPTDLAYDWRQDLGGHRVNISQQNYTFNQPQSIQDALSKVLQTKPDLIFFSGYAHDLETLLEDQSRNLDPQLRNIPVIAGDAAATMSDYTDLPSGLDHTYFTSFASQETNPGAPFFNIYRQTFPNFIAQTHVNDVDEDAILEYDAIEALLQGYQYQKNAPGKITLSQALRTMGACQGVSGQIAFDASGNPLQKYIVLEHVLIKENKLEVLDHSGNF
jgi:serine/threonine protein kinase